MGEQADSPFIPSCFFKFAPVSGVGEAVILVIFTSRQLHKFFKLVGLQVFKAGDMGHLNRRHTVYISVPCPMTHAPPALAAS